MPSEMNGGDDRKRKIVDFVDIKEEDKKPRLGDDQGSTIATAIAAASAAARASQIAKNSQANGSSGQRPPSNEAAMQKAKAAEMSAQLAAQMASVSSLLSSVKQEKGVVVDRKPAYRALKLDAQGREIDEYGQVVKTVVAKTIGANLAIEREAKKKENPYLAHQRVPIKAPPPIINGYGPPGATVPGAAIPSEIDAVKDETVDERITIGNRNARAKKSLKFVEAGVYVQKAEEERYKEERKIIGGYTSGRKAPEVVNDDDLTVTVVEPTISETKKQDPDMLPPRPDGGLVPVIEWWDEIYLPKEVREIRKKSAKVGSSSSGSSGEPDLYTSIAIENCKTHMYVQHPVAVKALGGEKLEVPLPMYLTKTERKRIRKTAREEREREKRDKMMMGLLPAPEPKFKLSNFMKVLGDQAVADPSKVEMKVLQQMRQRELNHEMRNLAAKLTPGERKAKRTSKLQEDTSRQVHVAVFRIKDLADAKHRFKVDVNAQQHFLSGTVILCQPQPEEGKAFQGVPKGMNLVVVEDG
mmetsp:Transcript_36097/g.34146  ORF Transcript_36097/g.34146 Transcript_36097/m.34146 type:complete len:526 (-) Transcript_36097:7-1584(-)